MQKAAQRMLILTTSNFIQNPMKQPSREIQHIQLQCQGYALFDKQTAIKQFARYLTGLIKSLQKNHNRNNLPIKTIKINFNGFNLKQHPNFFTSLAQNIKQIGINLKTLWVHTSDIEDIKLEDFLTLFKLMFELAQTNNINFQDFSLQCANWKFHKQQPSWQSLKNGLQQQVTKFLDDKGQIDTISLPLKQKHIRIQMSGWYYDASQAQAFLKTSQNNQQQFQKQVQQFHLQFKRILDHFIQLMDQTQQFQIDMRNTHQLLKMKDLKHRLLTGVTNNNKSSKSIISMRHHIQANQGEKQFRFNVVM